MFPAWLTVFVVSPIGEIGTATHKESKLVLDYVIRKALPAEEFEVIRADDEQASDSISVQIIRRIVESDYVVAVLSDRNPNVFYELAIAHGFAKPVIAMMSAGQIPHIRVRATVRTPVDEKDSTFANQRPDDYLVHGSDSSMTIRPRTSGAAANPAPSEASLSAACRVRPNRWRSGCPDRSSL